MSQEPTIRDQIRAMRRSYGVDGISEAQAGADPIALFLEWLGAAAANPYIVEANAMVLATQAENEIHSRSVLLKDFDQERAGFTFFTNYNSAKAREISKNPKVSLLFPWYAMERQVIINGSAEKISIRQSQEYFATRPWASQLGAWASEQSEVISGREVLEQRWRELSESYPEGSALPAPEHWGGFSVLPHSIEFWQGRYSRLHDRLHFTRQSDGQWSRQRLAP